MLESYIETMNENDEIRDFYIADAYIRAIRAMFQADSDFLEIGLASMLKVLIEQHIGLRAYYPQIAAFYEDVRTGRLNKPLPLDAVTSIGITIGKYTPEIFDPSVGEIISCEANNNIVINSHEHAEATNTKTDKNTPQPPRDPIGEIDQNRANDQIIARTLNSLWVSFTKGESVAKSLKAWRDAYEIMLPFMRTIIEFLKAAIGL